MAPLSEFVSMQGFYGEGEIADVEGHLLLVTAFGATVVENHKLRRFFVDQTTDGRL